MRLDVNPVPSPQLLADAFSEFIAASSVLEASYRDLQQEVTQLSSELSQRNAALTRSLEENTRMRGALQQILDSMPCGVLVLNQAERFEMINPEGRRLLGLGNARVETLQVLAQISKVDFESYARGAGDSSDSEVCLESPSGKRWLAVSYRKLAAAGFKSLPLAVDYLHSIWILRDVTANKHAEIEREAARRATTLAEISTILAHEIKNPLASMELFAGLIEQDPQDAAQWISHLRAGVRTLSGTVNNVLSLNGDSKPRLAQVRLADCIESGVIFVSPIAEQAGVALSYSAKSTSCSVLGNEDAIRQIVLNLVCNAIRHTKSGGSVMVTVSAATKGRSHSALVAIQDTGCGIPEHVLPRIFDAGFSAAGETPGLGLAVCKRLMNQHSGEIRVTSRVNEGSTFELEFPVL
jgi:nitrogen-specific signal transduction histidine kinase